ncbi:PREDICTED: nuclear pore [Prunus dulcis]|uniref:PREDICTED: nuclear pore n=1 Tax=Prunus dulcis TaxID=3755 RepID=A0A5E4EPV8_PRUDU|nr:PREDICTED: nuclear pore [Prunus dulcis]
MLLDPPSPVFVLVGAAVRYSLIIICGNEGQDSLSLYMTPLSTSGDPVEGIKAIPSMTRWNGVSDRRYLIQMKVFSQGPDAQEMYITESDDIKLSDYWIIFPVSDDVAIKRRWQNSIFLKILKVAQEVMVCDQVSLSLDKSDASPTNFRPWAPAIYQEVELQATGGGAEASSDYKWFSSDMGIVSVSASGVVQAKKPGKASSLIAAYSPLSIRQAGDANHFGGYFFDLALAETDKQLVKLDKIYLVPGMHLDVMLLGGGPCIFQHPCVYWFIHIL